MGLAPEPTLSPCPYGLSQKNNIWPTQTENVCVYVSVLACVWGGGTYERDLVGNGTTVDPKTEDDSGLGVGDGVGRLREASLPT